MLELERTVKHYHEAGQTVRAIDGVSLRIAPGELVVLYGPSGAGKSTLLRLAGGFLPPERGSVRFMGGDLADMSAQELSDYQRRDVGFIYQSAELIDGMPAVENAAIKLLVDRVSLREARVAATQWLERLGLADRAEQVPERMSGGERQRVAIARALVNRPRLILADEPTGSLDSRRGLEVLQLLADIAREQHAAIVVVTHDPQAANIASRTLWLRDGKIVESAREAEDAGRNAMRRLSRASE